jgi:transposase
VPGPAERRPPLTPQQRLLLDAWARSGLPAADFAPLVGVSRHTLCLWKKRFDEHGPAGLADRPRGAPDGSRPPEVTRRTILLLKQSHPDWGCQKVSDLLPRGPALPASAAVARALRDAGYALEGVPGHAAHGPAAHRFERAGANQLWQTDADEDAPRKQRHTASQVFRPLCDEHQPPGRCCRTTALPTAARCTRRVAACGPARGPCPAAAGGTPSRRPGSSSAAGGPRR